jgi:hypothetical protein
LNDKILSWGLEVDENGGHNDTVNHGIGGAGNDKSVEYLKGGDDEY